MIRNYSNLLRKWVSAKFSTPITGPAVDEFYYRPGGVDQYLRPGGVDKYIRP